MNDFGDLTERVRRFAEVREWEQFHTPRNLALALVGEVGELAAELQWEDDAQLAAGLGSRRLGI